MSRKSLAVRNELTKSLPEIAPLPDKWTLVHYAKSAPIESWDDYTSLLVEFVALGDASAFALGAAIHRGWGQFGQGQMGKTEFVGLVASDLPISRATVFKAWFYYLYPNPPEDMPPSTLYEIASKGGGEDAIEAAQMGGWSSFDARCVGTLVQRGLLDEWTLPHLHISDGGYIVARVNGMERIVGWLDVAEEADNQTKAGAQLLRLKARI